MITILPFLLLLIVEGDNGIPPLTYILFFTRPRIKYRFRYIVSFFFVDQFDFDATIRQFRGG